VVFGIQRAPRISRVVICGLFGSAIFSYYLISGKIFEKKFTEDKMCVYIFSATLSEKFLILRRNERNVAKKIHWSYVKYP